MKRIITIAALIALVLTLSLSADAQHRGRGFKGKGDKHRRMENFETLRKMKLIETLELTEEQADKFLPIFTSHRKKMREIRRERITLLDSLSHFLKQENVEKDIGRVFELLNHNEKKTDEEKFILANEISEILDVYQMGRFILFKERFEKDIIKKLFDYRKRGRTFPPNEDDGI
ncbi:MAG: hypothetical protein V3V99_12140 [candidate division Zixibacteria bacterium]